MLSRVRALLATSGRAFVPRPPLLEAGVARWESTHQLRLPEPFRRFLLEVGDGGVMPGSYCDFALHPLERMAGATTAAAPCPITRARLDERLAANRSGPLLPELGDLWEQTDPLHGSLMLGRYPGGDALFLVTSGDLAGSVWCLVDGGVPELGEGGQPRDFLDWFFHALTDLTRPDVRA
ncbi:MAG: SMI1/KNR4 family protein [Archangiaceae bacterium]|nr:SMI1/KNR4 family protein [Archangiaceae bacterium]